MGRGLSDQQKDMLRAALSVNTEINRGMPTCRVQHVVGEPPRFRVLNQCEPPDLTPELAYVLVLKLPYNGYNTIDGRPGGLCRFVAPTPVTNAQKVSTHKALHRLDDRGLLMQYCLRTSNAVSIHGYLLTQQGIDTALKLPKFECSNITGAISVFRQLEDGVIVDWRQVYKNEVFTAF